MSDTTRPSRIDQLTAVANNLTDVPEFMAYWVDRAQPALLRMTKLDDLGLARLALCRRPTGLTGLQKIADLLYGETEYTADQLGALAVVADLEIR